MSSISFKYSLLWHMYFQLPKWHVFITFSHFPEQKCDVGVYQACTFCIEHCYVWTVCILHWFSFNLFILILVITYKCLCFFWLSVYIHQSCICSVYVENHIATGTTNNRIHSLEWHQNITFFLSLYMPVCICTARIFCFVVFGRCFLH